MSGVTYREAGVDIDAGERLVERIRPLAARTSIPEVLSGVGGFAGLCALPSGLHDPVLVSGTDGVGTKLKVAFAADRHHTVGIDLVAMCVNDVVTTGARPLFFLDYFATGKLDVEQAGRVVEGIADGCRQAGCALLGGETAEMPGMYQAGEYDLAGFSVGVVERSALLPRADVQPGDRLLGLASDGLHSNGYSLARAVLLERAGLALDAPVDALGEPLVDALLRPTRIYAAPLQRALDAGGVKAVAHITGGGLPDNLPRIMPQQLACKLEAGSWPEPPIFGLIARLGNVPAQEMARTFNMGLGMVLVVESQRAEALCQLLNDSGERASLVGEVIARPTGAPAVQLG
ncbi:MAG: phosphoribosylformylglycinamidine cyclo-ligase [Myxococcales bacterium]|nr:phosphoribosylformylglycinamidine cyclo-ligase [Myxococcales bacterium]